MTDAASDSEAVSPGLVTTYQAGIVQATAYRVIKQAVSSYLQPYGISMMEWFALGTIRDHGNGGIRLTELARTLQTTLPYTTNLLHTLEAKGWVQRHDLPGDSRVKLARLAEGSEAACEAIEADLREKMREHIYSRITRDDFTAYIRTLYALSRP